MKEIGKDIGESDFGWEKEFFEDGDFVPSEDETVGVGDDYGDVHHFIL